MALKEVLNYLRRIDSATPVTPEKIMGLQREPSVYEGCTCVTPVTPHLGDTQGKAQFVPVDKASNDATTTPAADPDRWYWPHSTAMNGQEIDTLTARLARFTDKGVTLAQAEQAADRLVIRDREGDDRALCLECTHLQGAAGRWRCGNWQAAYVARGALAPELVAMLQRCPGLRLPAGDRADGQSTQGA